MTSLDHITADHVHQAMVEHDELGAAVFRKRYGFGEARHYVLWHKGKGYDSKAIVGVANRYATGRALRSDDFHGGKSGAAKRLWDLGFEVFAPKDEVDVPDPKNGEWRDAADVGVDASREEWAGHAHDVLVEVARVYHGLATHQELAALVQVRSGIRTTQLVHYWIGDVLGRVARRCAEDGDPLLSSLCVNASGSVGESYAKAVAEIRGEPVPNADDHAAVERLECYRRFGAEMPADGGRTALTEQVSATRSRQRKVAAQEAVPTVCPHCNMAVPATGICDSCD